VDEGRGEEPASPEAWLSDGQRRAYIKLLAILGPLITIGIIWMLSQTSGAPLGIALVVMLLAVDAACGYWVGRRFKRRPARAQQRFSPAATVGFILAPALGLVMSRLLGRTVYGRAVFGSLGVLFLLWLVTFLTGLHWERLPTWFKRKA